MQGALALFKASERRLSTDSAALVARNMQPHQPTTRISAA
jgi:hypothetical protein